MCALQARSPWEVVAAPRPAADPNPQGVRAWGHDQEGASPLTRETRSIIRTGRDVAGHGDPIDRRRRPVRCNETHDALKAAVATILLGVINLFRGVH
jgi:hypothetical protein